MKIPAIRANIGNWTYYITTLTFDQVNNTVEKIDDQLHKSESLKDLIQRSITKNYKNIKDYILNQPEMFFNSLVLAVYNGTPSWVEVELNYGGEEYFNMGFLDFPNDGEKIFPVDGQHRVEGIKSALKENPEFGNNKIGAIFIGHSTTEEGMQKSRRLFTTLNRYAKPVTMDDIIALDEDDSVAIVSRILLENHELFTGKKVTKSKNKAIPDNDKNSITSIITLYQCNRELLKYFRKKRKNDEPDLIRDKKSLYDYLKFRPDEKEINLFEKYCMDYWDSFVMNNIDISNFVTSENENPASPYRNRNNGGNLLFRPVGLLPYVQASLEIHKRGQVSFQEVHSKLNGINLTMNETPWKNVMWNPFENIMIMGSTGVVKLLLIYMYGNNTIRPHELQNLKEKYASKINFEGDILDNVLDNVPVVSI